MPPPAGGPAGSMLSQQHTGVAMQVEYAPVHELARAIQTKKLTAKEATESFLGRIERHGEKLHAFVAVYGAEARQAAGPPATAIPPRHAVGPRPEEAREG